jgi:CarboxypepD_reg-like domain
VFFEFLGVPCNTIKSHNMKTITIIILLILPIIGFSQRTITGTVTYEENGSAIPGTVVIVKDTTIATLTDYCGKYSISVPDKTTILVFSYMGMDEQEVEIFENVVDAALFQSKGTIKQVNYPFETIDIAYMYSDKYSRKCKRKQKREARKQKRQSRKNNK